MSTLGNALPSNRTALENALLRIEAEARTMREADLVSVDYASDLYDALDALDKTRDAIRASVSVRE